MQALPHPLPIAAPSATSEGAEAPVWIGPLDRTEWTAADLAELALPGFPATKRRFTTWLQRNRCQVEERPGPGGMTQHWNAYSFPQVLRLALARRLAAALTARGELPRAEPAESDLRRAEADLVQLSQLPDAANRRAVARMMAVRAWQGWRAATSLSGLGGAARFADAWAAGAIETQPWVRETLASFCGRSLLDWERRIETRGASALGGDYRAREHIINTRPELLARAEAAMAEYPTITADRLRWLLIAKFGMEGMPSRRAVARWMTAWKDANKSLHAYNLNPDRHKATFIPAAGIADQGISRLNQVWEFDDTPGDVLLDDGKRYTVIGCIDIFSRRLMLHVHPSASSAGVALLMRRALLAWGVPEVVRTDNGAAYVSKHICAVLKRLAVTHDVLPPFSPEKKPFIERALKTFAYDLVEGLPGYTGHSVAEAQAIRSRKTFAQRLFGRDEVATIGMSPAAFAQFCDRWCEAYNSREHGTLRTTPALRAAQHQGAVERIKDERALDLLLAPIGGWRQVSRTGIRIDGGSFLAPQLGDLVGERVECRIDEADAGRLYVFDGDGRFVCIAEDPERTGMSRQAVATAMRARAAKTLGEARRDQRATRKAAMPEPHEQRMIDIVEARLAAAPKVLAFPGRAEPSARAGVVEAGRAARAEEAPVARPRTEADAAAAAKLATLAEARRVEQARDPRAERAARIARGLAAWDALKAGAAIPETERAFFQGYEESPEFLGALAAARGVDIRRGHYRPLGKATAAAG